MLGLFIIFVVLWCIFGGLITFGIVEDEEMDDFLPNKDKRKLVIFLLGPMCWITYTVRFIFTKLNPIVQRLIEWFCEE